MCWDLNLSSIPNHPLFFYANLQWIWHLFHANTKGPYDWRSKMVRSRCFFSGPTKKFSFQIREKIERRKWGFRQKWPCTANFLFFFSFFCAVLGTLPPFFSFLLFPSLAGRCLILKAPFFFFSPLFFFSLYN